ncbi:MULTISPECIES: hypothetical protein [Cryobacterium]|nr:MULTISPECIES: hypothetical protein [Cryobacterium]MDY7528243.1 hypothetical protein [Cryobacterium sp. 10C2]MDY7556011.1 hypothetical protein [Cryobacterium sp. 10C3]MEB0002396.1 hypothetical protein [Cryobacterium sp. RTC2.1]MEB0200925.1 hypothetical protein [Cryobacterium sp. 5I3]MEB0286950.1 hypothetical protein [Cryobacterium sp. 10S3]
MDDAQARIDAAPLPGTGELRRRSNPVLQFIRFLGLNWTMYRLAKHHD